MDRTHEVYQPDAVVHEDEQTLIHYDDVSLDLSVVWSFGVSVVDL